MIASKLRRSLRWLMLVLVFVALFSPTADKVLASHGPPCTSPDHEIIYGRNANCGYFLNNSWNGFQPYGGSGVGLLTGINDQFGTEALFGADSAQRFIDIMRFHLQPNCTPGGGANDDRRRNAAAFIILTMQGAPAGTPANAPCTSSAYSFARWESLVRQYDAAGLVDWNPTDLVRNGWFTRNTRIQGGAPDAAWYPDPNCNNPLGFCAEPSIIFRSATDLTPLYMIKKNCANPIDRPRPLTPLTHEFNATPSANTVLNPNTESPVSATFSTGVSYTGAPFNATLSWRYFILRNGSSVEELLLSGHIDGHFTGPSYNRPPVTLPLGGSNLQPGDRVCSRTRIAPAAGQADPAGNIISVSVAFRDSPNDCETVVTLPYHQVYSGDTRVGSGFLDTAGVCATDTGARIIGLNKDGSPNFTGSGSQLAAFVFDQVAFFATGQLRTNATQAKPLTFANVNPSRSNFGAGGYGGGLMNGQAVCAPNFYDDGIATATNPLGGSTAANIPEGIYERTGNLNITGGTLGLGSGSRVIYVEGNVTISDNIQYAGTTNPTFNDLDNIPSFRLIVRGNIYVQPNVSRLDGIYIAQPETDGTEGRFYTCAPGGAPPTSTAQLNDTGPNGCRSTKLTVYGAVIADLIKLTRSTGTVNQATNTSLLPAQDAAASSAAEVFIMTPEAWLVSDFSGGGEFNSVTTLPPVL